MENCKSSVRKYLTNLIEIRSNEAVDFQTAKELAKEKAKSFCSAPMLLSWYNSRTGEYVPKAECGRSDKPGWITYAESRGGSIIISVNESDYIFMFKPYP